MKGTLYSAVRTLYNRLVRPSLPYKISVHNGVPVKGVVRLFDQTERFPDYEGALLSSLREWLERGDDVVIVGGGLGVSTVAAARATGPQGRVRTYEASNAQCDTVWRTVELNDVSDRVTLAHSRVGRYEEYSHDKYGPLDTDQITEPVDLPECDLLELDCEGAELDILEEMEIRPRIVVVETHGFLDSSQEQVLDLLTDAGYEVVDKKEAIPDMGVHVLTGVYRTP